MNPEEPGGLEEEVRALRARVERLEIALYRQGILAEAWTAPQGAGLPPLPDAVPAAEPVQVAAPVAEVPPSPMPPPHAAPPPPVRLPSFATMGQGSVGPERSLESRIGSQWFNRIGILAVLIGMAWFLKFAIDNEWIGPLGRVLIGLVAGGGLIAWSERFRAKGYRAFSYSLKSVGTGILYLSLWAAFSLYHLIPGGAAFAAMVAVTAFNGYLAWAQDAELLAVYAIAGGFSTPLLVSTGENHEIALFSYMLLLDVTVLVLVALRPWSRLLFGAFTGTALYALGWAISFYTPEQAGRTAFFFACFFLLFALAPRLVRVEGETVDAVVETALWDKLATVLLPLANAVLGFTAFYCLLESTQHHGAQPWLAVAFAGFYLALLRMPTSGRWRPNPQLLGELHLAAAVVFLTVAIPLKAEGRWLTIGWLAEGAALVWVAARARLRLLEALSILCLVLALGSLLVVDPRAGLTPVFNQRFATYVLAIATFAFVAWVAQRVHAAEPDAENSVWKPLALGAALLVNLLTLLAIGREIDAFWWGQGWTGSYTVMAQRRIYAQFSYSAFFMLYGAGLLALGFARQSKLLRWQAMVLLAVTIAKVFLVDVSELSQGYRIVSFLGLGALLLAVSFVYQKDWFGLRGREGDGR
ncbi:MAG: DUF2339 domain-containing protein [Terracidiphilus sp.]|nr:DUF2339 domain-containing protein [Terracidiphilus sp.]